MDDKEKLAHLLEHWRAHNDEHAETYRGWAAKAKDFGNSELSAVLTQIAEESERQGALFLKASDILRSDAT